MCSCDLSAGEDREWDLLAFGRLQASDTEETLTSKAKVKVAHNTHPTQVCLFEIPAKSDAVWLGPSRSGFALWSFPPLTQNFLFSLEHSLFTLKERFVGHDS